jgi:hypothetical protein
MLNILEERGLVSTKRGQIRVVDRGNLEAVAGDSYGVCEAEYARLIGLPLRPHRREPEKSSGDERR